MTYLSQLGVGRMPIFIRWVKAWLSPDFGFQRFLWSDDGVFGTMYCTTSAIIPKSGLWGFSALPADLTTALAAPNLETAAPEAGTIRADFADSIDANAVHGSDSAETAAVEIAYFFATVEICHKL